MRDFWKRKWRSFLLFLTIVGPGLITANADNDAGGIATYATIGAKYGYKMLWGLLLITFSLAIIQEMSARMGVVTGKGLSDLIREQFGVRLTLFAMVTLFLANIGTVIAEFAGIAASLDIFGVPSIISVPVVALLIWLLVVKGSYALAEKAFLILSLVFLSYVVSGVLAKPDWHEVLKASVHPQFVWDGQFILLFIGMIGTTITPWMQFFLQSSVVDKEIAIEHYAYERADVLIGAFITDFIAFFIIVSTAATLYKTGVVVSTAEDAARALGPLAGANAKYLFALGLFGASTLGAGIVPLSTSYAICEAFGWESSINRKFKEAPIFFTLYTLLIAIGACVIFIPVRQLFSIMLVSQVINGILVPIILIFMLKLTNDPKVMGEHTNKPFFNILSYITVGAIILLTVVYTADIFIPIF
ncbi:NRAMP (natural resistance-associated macrophage protein)-like metal ion transporter [Hydrogenispora ethanolica]|jgi:NRAMP (natural resistance-associated macrophage protein)-like metal ion transporter|uniref:NRAMP (Natural resistance-associated macrophage protein)-like metal ion transporter n=1 Tax=Hydrogenispora ethanolica TaxID=1082276 RepID=A0A4R1RAJ9_HYDET|nr:Nramp family divalent metal transporter [Hydrogenispora ethanolica]TCL62771.1 NRAMP (natural resistance-associated macrophage protein)-like metal ion transporter [Hydrogenispora ethanolica]